MALGVVFPAGRFDTGGRFTVVDLAGDGGARWRESPAEVLCDVVGGDVAGVPFRSPVGMLTAYFHADGSDDPAVAPNPWAAWRLPRLGLRLYPQSYAGVFVFLGWSSDTADDLPLTGGQLAGLGKALEGPEPPVRGG